MVARESEAQVTDGSHTEVRKPGYSSEEYITLTVLRVTAKALHRVIVPHGAFRSQAIRRIIASAYALVREAIAEIESYHPEVVANEAPLEENSVGINLPEWETVKPDPKIILIAPRAPKRKNVYNLRKPQHWLMEYICPHCGKTGRGNIMKARHFDHCPQRKEISAIE